MKTLFKIFIGRPEKGTVRWVLSLVPLVIAVPFLLLGIVGTLIAESADYIAGSEAAENSSNNNNRHDSRVREC